MALTRNPPQERNAALERNRRMRDAALDALETMLSESLGRGFWGTIDLQVLIEDGAIKTLIKSKRETVKNI